ncbi:MAG: zinc ribbon domain-containing protein [Chloroflexales bacterium]
MGFLDQIGKTLTQGVDRAKFEAEKFQKTTRLQGEVNEFRHQLDAKLMELGQRAYDLQRAGQISAPSISEMASAIDQLRATVVAKEEELKLAQSDVFVEPTPSSHAPSQSVPVTYEMPSAVPTQASTTKACAGCGFQMPATAMFCPSCGTRTA